MAMESRLLSIMFVDVQGFTRRTAAATREETEQFIRETQEFVKTHLTKWSGRLVKTMGDGFMAAFDSPTNAAQCGLEMQKKLETRNANMINPDHFIRFRIGINTGEVSIDENGDLYGDPVNIAARIEGFCEPNAVYISEATFLAMNKNELGALDLGPQMFKNATREIRIYRLFPPGAAPALASAASAAAKAANRPAAPAWVGGVAKKVALALVCLLLFVVVARNVVRIARRAGSAVGAGVASGTAVVSGSGSGRGMPVSGGGGGHAAGHGSVASASIDDPGDDGPLAGLSSGLEPTAEEVETFNQLVAANKLAEAEAYLDKLVQGRLASGAQPTVKDCLAVGSGYLLVNNKTKAEKAFSMAIEKGGGKPQLVERINALRSGRGRTVFGQKRPARGAPGGRLPFGGRFIGGGRRGGGDAGSGS